ncbi:helix-turn-helix domain-containing protein [Acidocella aminolytica]|jgi:AraC family transcriptional activator of pobA|uniref:Transcriptional regulator AraC n=1 Tax=Acidocella aminolytica 101 = DSM 11237 TaxID=1120923 RepID=A0A0D6PLL9_9PROT|nr:helix-turn-helix domain-containing protein [Acidocella aminolytica]GAN82108.1 transcriptional regulator AraC [Acidocella aminolytica 101 = DSM 11237]GBQ41445.1 AraC family transcriptional regulator [Acidocella aminolytica 101 = DSM 11237]SHF62382.1 AraC family transcriptional regulator, transcriptional activator of pobA [Acidocella aminolytica 101 = DSM 11237]
MKQQVEFKIPHFYLYGDPHSDVDMNLLHAEPIRDRSSVNDWTIRTHVHPDHAQLLLVTKGGGWIRMEARRYDVVAPALVVIPLACVHDMEFSAGTDGEVITVSKGYLAEPLFNSPELLASLNRPSVHVFDEEEVWEQLVKAFSKLRQEFIWRATFRRQAITALLLHIFVHAARLSEAALGVELRLDRNYDLLNRFRALLEQDFRQQKRLEYYSGVLGVTVPRLNAACKARAGKAASRLLHERVIIEAKRILLYSGLSVAEVGHQLGFEDPAYFNRFFSQRVGQPPAAYRQESR